MPRFTEDSKQRVIAAADMVDVVSGRTQLRKVGSRYTGRCPFHEERTPSFSVNAVDKLYYCFGCGAGGDLIKFVRETEQLDFAGAVEWLAERFRVQLEYEEMSPQLEASRKRRDRLHEVLDQAAAFYERHLWETEAGAPVREYLESRGLGEAVCREFRLGLSPGTGLAQKAQQKGFTRDELRGAGLTNARGNDYFPRRLMFPLADARGRIVGFQARKLHEDDPLRGKYVNSPEGELFHKSAILYGLHLARHAIAKQERGIVVEGNTDVIALRQAGLEPVVASMGTALTERHVKELSRLTRRLYLCFDADAAGEAATLRGMELAVGQGLDVRVVTLPPGQDPADAAGRVRRSAGRRRELRRLPRPPRARAGTGSADGPRAGAGVPRRGSRLAGAPGGLAARERPARDDRPAAERGFDDEGCAGLPQGHGRRRPARAGRARRLHRLPVSARSPPASPGGSLRQRASPSPARRDPRRRRRRGDGPALAELDAVASSDAIDEPTAKELLLRLRERHLRRRLAEADLEETSELQQQLLEIRAAVSQLA